MEKAILSVPKNSRDEIRLALSEYMGHDLVNFRIWTGLNGETKKPTAKGITFNVKLLPEIIAGLQQAEIAAREGGLL